MDTKKEEKILNEFEKKEKKKKIIPDSVRNVINKRMFENFLIAVGIMFFILILIFGFHNIDRSVYYKDLQVFSIALCVVCILLFENSYKKEDGKICIWGIESLVLALFTLFSTYLCKLQETNYVTYLALISYVFAIYYIAKNIKIYKKLKKEYIRSLSDIKEIVKKEEPEKKEKTERKRK